MIEVKVVKHSDQRYPTIGDWQFSQQGQLTIKVSDTDDAHMNFLIAIHEIIEAYLCRANGISAEMVDSHDLENSDHPDPGSIPGCIYYREHMIATMIERVIAAELQMDWNDYEFEVEKLCK